MLLICNENVEKVKKKNHKCILDPKVDTEMYPDMQKMKKFSH